MSIYYFPNTELLNQNFTNSENFTQKTHVNNTKNLTIETASALPFFSSIFSNFYDDPRSYNRKIINNSEKQNIDSLTKLEKSPYHYEKSYKNLQDLLNLYNNQNPANEGILEYKGYKFKGVIRNPENVDLQGSNSEIYKHIFANERSPLDPFYR